MFKVICIDANPGFIDGQIPPFKEGQTLEASQAPYHQEDYIIYPEKYIGWHKKRFIPLSNIDELELTNHNLVNE